LTSYFWGQGLRVS